MAMRLKHAHTPLVRSRERHYPYKLRRKRQRIGKPPHQILAAEHCDYFAGCEKRAYVVCGDKRGQPAYNFQPNELLQKPSRL